MQCRTDKNIKTVLHTVVQCNDYDVIGISLFCNSEWYDWVKLPRMNSLQATLLLMIRSITRTGRLVESYCMNAKHTVACVGLALMRMGLCKKCRCNSNKIRPNATRRRLQREHAITLVIAFIRRTGRRRQDRQTNSVDPGEHHCCWWL